MSFTGKTDPQVDVYRRLAPWQRMAAACQLYWFAREIIKERTKRAKPNISEADLEREIRSYL